MSITWEVRIRLLQEEGAPFMGIGLVWLLDGIVAHKSIRGAAQAMELSYPKALRMVRELEAGVAQSVVVRERGGAEHGGAHLTPFGEDFLARYKAFLERVERSASDAYAEELAELLD